ncbi:MAG: hypothetical protein ABJL67_02650 [Sulfitobacter sp.]
MNMPRELILILSTFCWIGAGIWIAVHIIASGTAPPEQFEALKPNKSYYVFGISVMIFVLTTFLWKKKKDQ